MILKAGHKIMALAEAVVRNIIWFSICSHVQLFVFDVSKMYSLLSWQSLNAAFLLALHRFFPSVVFYSFAVIVHQ